MLLSTNQMPRLPGLDVPREAYFALSEPALLAGMVHPDRPAVWGDLHRLGIRHVVCLTDDQFSYRPAPVNPLLAIKLEDLCHGRPPVAPQAEKRKVIQAATAVARAAARGEGVAVHCAGGTGRTGTVLGAALCLLGYPPEDVLSWLRQVNRDRGKEGWPEAAWQASIVEGITPDASIMSSRRGES